MLLNSSKFYSKWGKYGNVGIWHVKVAWIHLVDCYEGLYHVDPCCTTWFVAPPIYVISGYLRDQFSFCNLCPEGSCRHADGMCRNQAYNMKGGWGKWSWRIRWCWLAMPKAAAEGCQSAPANFLSPKCGWREHLHRIYIGFTGNTCIYLILAWRTMASSNFSLEWSYPHMQWLRDACWPSFRDFDLSAGFNSVKVRFLAENVESGLHFFCTCCTHDELLIS